MSSVEALPVFMMVISAARWPSTRDDVGLRREAVAHVANVVDIDGGAVDGLDRQVVELRDGSGRAVGLYLVVDVAHLHVAGGQDCLKHAAYDRFGDKVDGIIRVDSFFVIGNAASPVMEPGSSEGHLECRGVAVHFEPG